MPSSRHALEHPDAAPALRSADRPLLLRHGRAILWFGALAPFIYTTPRTVETAASIAPIDLIRGGAPIACFIAILLTPSFKSFRIARSSAAAALAAFAAVAVLSVSWTDFSPQAALFKAVQYLFMLLCVAKVVATYEDFAASLRALLHVAHLILLGVLVQLAVAPSVTYAEALGEDARRLNSTIPAISANILGLLIGAGMLSLLLRVGPRWAVGTWLRWPLLVLYASMLLATRSRMITVALALILVVSGLIAMCRNMAALQAGLLAMAGATGLAWWALGRQDVHAAVLDFATRGQDTGGLRTLTGRTIIWDRSLEYWERHPFLGGGYYSGHRFALADFDPLFRAYSNVDSTWIETLVDLGLVGTTLLAVFVGAGTWQLVRVDADRYTKLTALGLWLAIVAMSFVNPTFQAAQVTAVLAGALVLGSTHRSRRRSIPGSLPGPARSSGNHLPAAADPPEAPSFPRAPVAGAE